jgi:hypothetical protein
MQKKWPSGVNWQCCKDQANPVGGQGQKKRRLGAYSCSLGGILPKNRDPQ